MSLPPLEDIEKVHAVLWEIISSGEIGWNDEVMSGVIECKRCLCILLRHHYGPDGAAMYERLEN